MVGYPLDLPKCPLRGTFSAAPDDNRRPFQPDQGAEILFAASTAVVWRHSMTIRFTPAEYQSLMTFYYTTLERGVLPFTFPDRALGGTGQFIFSAPPGWAEGPPGLGDVVFSLVKLPS